MDLNTLIGHLKQFPLLSALSPDEFKRISELVEFRNVPKHQFIYLADEPATHLFFLLNGPVKIGIYSHDGREIIKSIQHPYSVFGELVLTGESTWPEFACAMNRDVQCLAIPANDFRQFMVQNQELGREFLLMLGHRLRRAERQWESLIVKDVRSRIIEFLKDSAGERGRQIGYETLVKHGLTQQDIANLVGASRQTVTAILNELRKSNLIYFNRNSILIRDVEKLN